MRAQVHGGRAGRARVRPHRPLSRAKASFRGRTRNTRACGFSSSGGYTGIPQRSSRSGRVGHPSYRAEDAFTASYGNHYQASTSSLRQWRTRPQRRRRRSSSRRRRCRRRTVTRRLAAVPVAAEPMEADECVGDVVGVTQAADDVSETEQASIP